MSAPWTKEQAEQWADAWCDHMKVIPSYRIAFLAGLAKAAEMIEACPTMYGSPIGDPINRYWENKIGACDTHTAKLVGVKPIREG